MKNTTKPTHDRISWVILVNSTPLMCSIITNTHRRSYDALANQSAAFCSTIRFIWTDNSRNLSLVCHEFNQFWQFVWFFYVLECLLLHNFKEIIHTSPSLNRHESANHNQRLTQVQVYDSLAFKHFHSFIIFSLNRQQTQDSLKQEIINSVFCDQHSKHGKNELFH